jgi:elongation of very long chain fatty acids protein 7
LIYRNILSADSRVAHWSMMSSPIPTIAIVLLYIYFVKVHQITETLPPQPKLQFLGPQLMKNRKPFQLKTAILVYNLLQVLLSTYLFYEVPPTLFVLQIMISLQIGMSGWFTGEYSLRCQPVDYSNEPSALRVSSCTTLNPAHHCLI